MKIKKIILILSLFICNFAFSQDTTIIPKSTLILDQIEVRDKTIRIWVTKNTDGSSILYLIKEGRITVAEFKLTKF